MKLFLIGLPGSGKTTLGKQLAEKLRVKFLDLDAEIEKQEKKTVREIFAENQEPYFRQLESSVLKRLCTDSADFVLATGGGTPCFFKNMDEMNLSGKTIFLNVPVAEIASRLSKTNLAERPLFGTSSGEQLKEKLAQLHSTRLEYYSRAHIIFNSEKISAEEIIGAL